MLSQYKSERIGHLMFKRFEKSLQMSDIETEKKTLKELKLIAEKNPELGKRSDYEVVWETTWEQCQKILAEGENDLSRLVMRVRNQYRVDNSDPNLAKKYWNDEENRKKTGYIFDRKLVRFDSMSTRFQPTMLEPLKLMPIIESCGEDVERIIELGSGWGRNLFKVWLNGGARNAEYWALDITETGAKIANAVAQASGKINLITHNFDFNFPDSFSVGSG